MAERAYGATRPETATTVAGADWGSKTILRETHTKVLFVDLDLTDSRNIGSVFNECTFRRTRFSASVHEDAAFVNCTFISCRFFDTRFVRCKLMGSMFDGCSFDSMTVEGGDWSFVGLPGAKLSSALFEGVRMREADLTGVNCRDGVLRNSDLSGAWLHSGDFTKCDLRGSDLTALLPFDATLSGAIVTVDQTVTIVQSMGLDVRPD